MPDPVTETALPTWLEPLRGQSERKHRSRGAKVRPSDPCLMKPPVPSSCPKNPNKIRFVTEEDAIEFRIGRDREWLLRTETYLCSCGGFHFTRKKAFR